MLKSAILLFLVTLTLAHQGCIHDQLNVTLKHIDDNQPDSLRLDNFEGRMLQDSSQSIRIYADYTYLTNVSTTVMDYIQNQLMPSAISYYQAALTVNRSTSNIRFADECGGLAAPDWLATTGVAADLVILVTAENNDAESYLAYASPCALSQANDRPVVGMINFNLAYMYTAATVNLEANLITTIHEMAHVLGFSSNLYSFFKDSQGNTFNPIGTKVVNGQTVQFINAEPVLTKVRDYFGCTTAEGAYLENEGDQGSAGSHFERRVFFNEFMTASDITDSVISPFTLAVLEASGWYKVSYSMAEPFTWGKGKGCNFLDGVCMADRTTPSFTDEFCAPLQREGCTYTGRAVGVCGANAIYNDSSIPPEFNYFGNDTVVLDYFSDNCPYYVGYPDLDCENPDNKANAFISVESYGPNSRCFSGTLTTRDTPRRRTGFCFNTTCASENGETKLIVRVGRFTVTCMVAGEVTIQGYNGVFECPDPVTFCERSNPVYCERGCSGRGVCNNGVCMCPTGWGGADCGLRTFVDDCPRCASQVTKKACFGDTCACNPASKKCTGYPPVGIGNVFADDVETSTRTPKNSNLIGSWTVKVGLVMMAMFALI